MSKHLPTHGFRWLTEAEIRDLIIPNIDEEGEDGYFLEVDLHYPIIYIRSITTTP